MSEEIIFSCIIPCSTNDYYSQNLKELLASIREQDFDQNKIEILLITEGDSEQAKAIGIRQAKGEICAMFCADNYLGNEHTFGTAYRILEENKSVVGVYGRHYGYNKKDNSLNRYFSLIGNNDPIAFYLKKNDRLPWYERDNNILFEVLDFGEDIPSLGDNGFFIRSECIKRSQLDHYYPMDACLDMVRNGFTNFARTNDLSLWHRTSDNLITFLKKRYKYAKDLFCDRTDRRWKIIDTTHDKWLLLGFIISTITIIPCLLISIKGFRKIRDWAWFWHWPVCFGFLITYGLLACRNLLKYQSLSRLFSVQRA